MFDLYPKFADSRPPSAPTVELIESGGQTMAAYTWSQHRERSRTVDVAVETSTSLAPGSWQESAAYRPGGEQLGGRFDGVSPQPLGCRRASRQIVEFFEIVDISFQVFLERN